MTLKMQELTKPDEFLLPWGLQMSFCTGVCRRVLLREMVADLLPIFVKKITPIPVEWKDLESKYGIVDALNRKEQNLQEWASKLPEDAVKVFNRLIRYVLSAMQDTGFDKVQSVFRVAWFQKERPSSCLKIPCKKGEASYWVRILADSMDCATFAYVTTKCLTSDLHKCRGPTTICCKATALLETAVCRYHLSADSPQPWVLKDSERYSMGHGESLVVQVARQNTTDHPRLYVSWVRSKIPTDMRLRLGSRGLPRRWPQLRERQFEGSRAEIVLILAEKSSA
jgi:hypothetical protein